MNQALLLNEEFIRFSAAVAALQPVPCASAFRIVLAYESASAASWASEILRQLKRVARGLGSVELDLRSLASLGDPCCRSRAAASGAGADLLVFAFANLRKPVPTASAQWISGELAAEAACPRLIAAIFTESEAVRHAESHLAMLRQYAGQHGSRFFSAAGILPAAIFGSAQHFNPASESKFAKLPRAVRSLSNAAGGVDPDNGLRWGISQPGPESTWDVWQTEIAGGF